MYCCYGHDLHVNVLGVCRHGNACSVWKLTASSARSDKLIATELIVTIILARLCLVYSDRSAQTVSSCMFVLHACLTSVRIKPVIYWYGKWHVRTMKFSFKLRCSVFYNERMRTLRVMIWHRARKVSPLPPQNADRNFSRGGLKAFWSNFLTQQRTENRKFSVLMVEITQLQKAKSAFKSQINTGRRETVIYQAFSQSDPDIN